LCVRVERDLAKEFERGTFSLKFNITTFKYNSILFKVIKNKK